MAYRKYTIELAVDPGQPVQWSVKEGEHRHLADGTGFDFTQAALRAAQVAVNDVRQDPRLITVSKP